MIFAGNKLRHVRGPSLTFLAYLIPPAIYFMVLALRNRRRHPVIISGPGDFAGILFAISGLLLFGGPAILNAVYEQWRISRLLGRTSLLNGVGDSWYFWIGLWLLYFAVVIGGSLWMLRRRRSQSSIYNIEPGDFAPILMRALERLGLPWSRGPGGRIILGVKTGPGTNLAVREAKEQRQIVAIAVEAFYPLRHVTLHWQGDCGVIRAAVEDELAITLQQASTPDNRTSNWFLSISLLLFLLATTLLSRLIVSAAYQAW
jgi:hypothetical protein